jgi:uncharacterized pyridoxamine 5'-phosphate oxidase family protein
VIDLTNQNQISKFILENIDSHKQFALGTVSQQAKPWVVCLNLTYDEKFNIIWKSEKTTVHSSHVRESPNVSICVFSEDENRGDFGLYISAIAREVTDEKELMRLIQIRFQRKGKPMPPIADFTAEGTSRIYYAETLEMYFNDSRHAKTKVDMNVLRELIGKNWGEL